MFALFRKRLRYRNRYLYGSHIAPERRRNNENISAGHGAMSINRRGVGANRGLHHGGSEGSDWCGGSERAGHRHQQPDQHSANVHILGVGKSFFGIEQKGTAPGLDHYDFGIAGFNADEVIDKVKARNLKLEPGGTKESFKFW